MLLARPRTLSTLALAIALTGCPRADEVSSLPDDAGTRGEDDDASQELTPDTGADATPLHAATADAPSHPPDGTSDARVGVEDARVTDAVERLVTLVLASRDLPPQYVCLGSFARDAQGQPVGDPVLAGGPFGIPDAADPSGKALRSGFPYGTVVKLPLFGHDRMYFDGWLPIGFLVDEVDVRETVRGGDSPSCKRAWASARDVPGRQVRLDAVGVGESFLSAVVGCREGSSGSGCPSLATTLARLDVAPLAPSEGDGSLPLVLQVANLTASTDLQSIDVLLHATREVDGGRSGAHDAALLDPIAPLANALMRGQVSGAVHVPVSGFDPALLALAITPHGAAPCAPAAANACTPTALPIEPARARYAAPTGGATGAAWQGHQVLVVFGGAPSGGDAGVNDGLRLAMFRSTFIAAP